MAAILAPDAIRYEHGLKICEKIIPDSAVWNRDVTCGTYSYHQGDPYKANLPLSRGSGKVMGVTIHNTERIEVAAGTTCTEQYTRATWPNCNMGTVRVHYYVDEAGAWQNLRENEVGWHAADGTFGPGNNTTIALEIIMSGDTAADKQSEKNGALLTACLLQRYGLTVEQVYQHHDWYPAKNCPIYIRPHWKAFLDSVQSYLSGFSQEDSPKSETGTPAVTIPSGSVVKMLQDTPVAKSLDVICQSGYRYTIMETQELGGARYGRLKSGAGWIPLEHTERV